MPTRIYALAKELKLDNRQLVEICAQAGLSGKGSALASLTDEEVEVVRNYLKSRSRSTAAAPSGAAPTAVPRPEMAAPVRREDYLPPGGALGKPPVLPQPKDDKPAEPRKRPESEKPKTAKPTVRLAPLPAAAAPPAEKKAEEEKTQKPDIKLPVDAIRAAVNKQQGAKPLSEHLRQHEERKRAAAKGGKGRDLEEALPLGEVAGAGVKERRRPGKDGRERTAEEEPTEFTKLAGGREARQLKRKRAATTKRRTKDEEDDSPVTSSPRRRLQIHRTGTNTAAPRKSAIVVEVPCTVRAFSESIGVPARQVLGKLLPLVGPAANINATLDREMAELLAAELGIELEIKAEADVEEQVLATLAGGDDDPDLLVERPPVVTFLGHVDHGKTSLLDKILSIDVASGESGGITQHIRAYRIEKDGRPITFVDTPGHEAFTEMRARGAHVTDIAVLVVAADDGVMPQTEEAISHARAAGVPIVVALNKIDLPGVNVDRVYRQLAENDLLPAEWGGTTEVVQTSALTGQGLDTLLETLLTIAELHELKANPNRPAVGTCLEAQLHEGRGVVAKVIVQKGTLRTGDVIVCGHAFGRVKAMYDTLQPSITYDSAGPSTPVDLTGLHEAPAAGEALYVVPDIAMAREIAEKRAEQQRQLQLAGGVRHVTLENLHDRLATDQVKHLNLILRADTRGSIEAIRKELSKLDHPEVQVKVLQATVGGVTEADVYLADATDAVIIGFNVVPDEGARTLSEQRGVQIRRYDIIYNLTNDLRAALEGMLKPEQREVELGRVLVLRTFTISRVGTVAGCRVLKGTIERNARLRVIRENRIIGDYGIETLRREKDDVREVREGYECGIKLAGFNDIKEGDIFEAYRIEEFKRTF